MLSIKIALVGNTNQIAAFFYECISVLKQTGCRLKIDDHITYELVRWYEDRGFIGENGNIYQAKDMDAFLCFSLNFKAKIKFQEETKEKAPLFLTYNAGTMNPQYGWPAIKQALSIDKQLISTVNKKGMMS